jgi:hypothetical protein
VHLIILLVSLRPPLAQPRVYLAGLETLARQAADDPRNRLSIERARVSPLEPPGERLLEQRLLVKFAERIIRGRRGGGRTNPETLDLLDHAAASASFHRSFDARRRQGDTAVVERPVAGQALDDIIDFVWCELAAPQTLPELRAGQLAS